MRHFERLAAIHEQAKAYFHEHGTLIGAPHGTPREHFEKYAAMVRASHLAVTDLSHFGVNGIEDLAERYLCDSALNTIPLRRFDAMHALYRMYTRAHTTDGAARTQAEYTCCLKHILIYDVLRLKPEFTEYNE